jgi:RecA-family ATPase
VLVTLATIQPEAVEWAWPGRIPFGKLTLLIGDPGEGKSYLLGDLEARMTSGRPWPDGAPSVACDVIILSAEDGIADTIRPRLDRQGGDPRRAHVLEAVRDTDGPHLFQVGRDLPALEAALQRTRARCVRIDPLSAYLGGTDSHRDGEVRGLLAPLAALAAAHRAAIVGVMHLTKDAQRRLIARASGSIAFAGAARVVMVVGVDPDDATKARRFLVTVKNNLGAKAPGLAYTITDDGFRWESTPLPSTLSARPSSIRRRCPPPAKTPRSSRRRSSSSTNYSPRGRCPPRR